MNRLQKLQNRAIKIITNSVLEAPARPLLTSLGLRSIGELCEYDTILIAFTSLNNFAPNCLIKTSNSKILEQPLFSWKELSPERNQIRDTGIQRNRIHFLSHYNFFLVQHITLQGKL